MCCSTGTRRLRQTTLCRRDQGQACGKYRTAFENGVETDIILYLGLCNGAGWATSLDGRDAVLLGIEKIIELNWQDESAMQALIFHEIGHIWHKNLRESLSRGSVMRAKIHWLSSIKRDLPWSANIFYAKMTDTIIKKSKRLARLVQGKRSRNKA